MKNKLLALTLAVLTIGLIGSCRKINEKIDDIDKRVEGIEQEKIASIQNQIAGINQSIADLGTIRNDILNLQVAVGAKGEDISALQAADVALGKRIDDLKTYVGDLSKYAEKDWATATFATLEQLGATNKALSALEELIGELSEAGEASDARIAELDEKLSKSIKSAVSRVNASISTLEGRVSDLEQMIQSVTIVPAYSDGSVEMDEDGTVEIDCIIRPAAAVASLSIENFKVLLNEVHTKATAYETLDVSTFDVTDRDAGEVKITADISAYTTLNFGKALTAAVKVENGISKFTTGFVGITGAVTTVQTVPSSFTGTFTLANSKKVRLIIESRTTDLALQYEGTSHYPEKLEVRIVGGESLSANLSGYLPHTHVDFTQGHIDHTSLTTSSSTLAVVTPATIGTLEVKGGNVVIKGATVQTIEVAADAVADPVTKAPVQIVVETYIPEATEENPEPEEQVPEVTEIKAGASVIVAPAATVEVKVTATAENVKVANEGQGTVKDNSDQPIITKTAVKIGDTKYVALTDALNTVPEENDQPVTIDILENIVLKASEALSINKNKVIIDGQNHTITLDETDSELSKYLEDGASKKYGSFQMIKVTGNDVVLKNMTLDSKNYRGVSLATTWGGRNATYQNIVYKGKGSAHYYGSAASEGTLAFIGCTFNTCGYAIHTAESTTDLVVTDCNIDGWVSYGVKTKSATFTNCKFYKAEDKHNGTFATVRPYCSTAFTGCSFSSDYLTDLKYTGITVRSNVVVSLKNCTVDGSENLYELANITNSDDPWVDGGILAIDAAGNSTDGFTAGTFVAKQASDIKVNDSFVVKPVEGTANVFTVSAKPPVAKIGNTGYASLQAAFDAVPDGVETTVTLFDDATYATLGDKTNIGAKTVILNLNGYSITGHMRGVSTLTNSASLDGATLVNYANLTINGEGTIGDLEGDYHHNALVNMSNGTNLTINGGTFVAKSCCVYHYSASSEANTASINVNGGTFKEDLDGPTNKYVFGIGGKSGQTLTFNYREATSEGAKGIYCSLAGTTISIHSGSITAGINAICLSMGKNVTINIDGGTLKTLDSENHENNYKSTGSYAGSSLPIYASAFGSENIVCNISGGEFIYPYYSWQLSGTIPATWERVINAGKGVTSNVANANITASLTGGTYSTNQMLSDITKDDSAASGIVAEGYTCRKNDNVTWTVVAAN